MKAKTVRDLAAIARERRRHLGLSQSQLAKKAGVGRDWVVQFEKGKVTVEWGLVVRALRELGLSLELRVEESQRGVGDLDRILASAQNERRKS
ncbi:MAG TPA: helix-turn-helix domain-containing protein [Chthoniobacterales bacterium]